MLDLDKVWEENYDPEIDKIIDDKKLESRLKELTNTTFKIIELEGNNIKFQGVEDTTLYIQIKYNTFASYRTQKGNVENE